MFRVSNENSSAKRAAWLAELATALDQARQLVKELRAADAGIEAVELCARIEAAQREVQAMRLMRSPGGGQLDPECTKNLPWKRSA